MLCWSVQFEIFFGSSWFGQWLFLRDAGVKYKKREKLFFTHVLWCILGCRWFLKTKSYKIEMYKTVVFWSKIVWFGKSYIKLAQLFWKSQNVESRYCGEVKYPWKREMLFWSNHQSGRVAGNSLKLNRVAKCPGRWMGKLTENFFLFDR